MRYSQKFKKIIGEDNWNYVSQIKYTKNNRYIKSLLPEGAKREENFEYSQFRKLVLDYVNSLKVEDFRYKFSNSALEPNLYASVYACMLRGLFNDISSEEKFGWKQFLDGFQRDDGLYQDNAFYNDKYNEGDGWGARHLQGHIIIAYARLGFVPSKEFAFLHEMNNPDYIVKWLERLDYKKVWGSSNSIMNYGVCLQYARDFMGMNAGKSIAIMQEWLLSHIRKDCGMWYDGELSSKADCYEAIRGAYHIYPILVYDGIELPYAERALEIILKMQNKWGGFDYKISSSACADIDAVDPMLRLAIQTDVNKSSIEACVKKAMKWVLANQNGDGGFVFDLCNPFDYGGEKTLYSKLYESNIFATWFRVLSILYMENYLGKNKTDFVKIPGYEFPLYIE